MAGKFLTIEEAAAALGVSIDEINRLVDRKKLFPMRDGTALKFKSDEITRAKQSLDDDSSVTDDSVTDDSVTDDSVTDNMALDLDSPSLGGGVAGGSRPAATGGAGPSGIDDVVIGEAVDDAEWVLGGTSGVHGGSQTLVRGNADAAAAAEGSGMAVGGGSLLGGSDLEIDSLIASSASLGGAAGQPALPAAGGSVLDGGDMTLDLSLGSGAAASGIGGSAIGGSNPSLAGAGMSGPLDSGLSLEDGDLAASGVDLAAASGAIPSAIGGGSLIASGVNLGGMDLGGDSFDLGDTGDDESASVVIATEETGDSSFFATAVDDSASVSYDDSSGAALMPAGGDASAFDYPLEYAPDMTFSIWQILGLVCCVLLLLGGTLVMFDLVWTIRAPRTTPLSAPLLNALSEAFGWR